MTGKFDVTTRALILQELRRAVDLQIALWNAVQRIDELVDCGFDPLIWIQNASGGLNSGMELGEADLADFLYPISEPDLDRPSAMSTIQVAHGSVFTWCSGKGGQALSLSPKDERGRNRIRTEM